ncbi:unnamed protein product [Adineta ricciae]|uniref:Uncharacterized protein n=1 Tax=Adineta ricciae TaxID=249248 RepID=A0A816GCG6_ADIRI|nr:unnamed protein product [Adineta ricciae]
MATTTSMNPYRAHDSSVSVYQVPEFVVGGEKMLFHALYGNEAYEKLHRVRNNMNNKHAFFLLELNSFRI